MTEKEKEIYNLYLSTYRRANNQPYNVRKNFENFENDPQYMYIRKLAQFFNKFPQIKPHIYFIAPYELYKDTKHFDLGFYNSQKAIKAYTVYTKQITEQSPDTPEQIKFIKDSLRFMAMFCVKNKISLNDYINHKTGITYTWLKHLKQHDISVYILLEFKEVYDIIKTLEEDIKDMFIGNFEKEFFTYKSRYNNSKQAKYIITEGFKRLDILIKENNNKTK